MKFIILLIIIPFPLFLIAQKDNSSIKSKVTEVNDQYGKRVYFDSLHYHIIRRWHLNGNIYLESITDKKTRTSKNKEYYENGKLKEEGQRSSPSNIPFGLWKYYSLNGKLDKIVDYEKKYKCPFLKAKDIALKKGFQPSKTEIHLFEIDKKTYWKVDNWTYGKDNATAETILIDVNTGKVTKPKYQTIGIY